MERSKERKISDFYEYYDCGTNEVSNKFRTFLFASNTFKHTVELQAKHLNISQMIFGGFKGHVSSIRMEIAIGPKSDIITMSRRTWNLRRNRDGTCRPLLRLTAVATDRSVFRREKDVCSPVVSNVCVVVLYYLLSLHYFSASQSVCLSVRLSITRRLRVATRPSCMTCKVSGRVQCTQSSTVLSTTAALHTRPTPFVTLAGMLFMLL